VSPIKTWASLFLVAFFVTNFCSAEETNDDSEENATAIHELWLTRYYDPGVLNRYLLEYVGSYDLTSDFSLTAALSLSPLEQVEPALIGGEIYYLMPALRSSVTFGIQQERWHSWQVTENRMELFWNWRVIPSLYVSAGIGYRSPQYAVNTFWQSFAWPSEDAEFNLIYRVEWKFLEWEDLQLSTILADYDRMRLYSLSNVHMILKAEYSLDESWSCLGYFSVGVKGLSGSILSFSQYVVSLGANYAL
jgi:hypothetical protein